MTCKITERNTKMKYTLQACSALYKIKSRAVDLADFALHPYRAYLAQRTMRLLR